MKISELKQDRKNANRGTSRGAGMISRSLKELGSGRSILLDRKGRIIAGNKTAEQAAQLGMEEVIIVPSDGTKIVAVQRTDLDLEEDPRAKKLAIADNRTAEVSLDWDPKALEELADQVNLDDLFTGDELEAITGPGGQSGRIDKLDMKEPPEIVWILVGVNVNKFGRVRKHLEALESNSEIIVKAARHEKNGQS